MYYIDSAPIWLSPAPRFGTLKAAMRDARARAKAYGATLSRVHVLDEAGAVRYALRRSALGWRRDRSAEDTL